MNRTPRIVTLYKILNDEILKCRFSWPYLIFLCRKYPALSPTDGSIIRNLTIEEDSRGI